MSILHQIDAIFTEIVSTLERVFFYSVGGFPLIILWIIGGGIFCTCRMGFINVRAFKHAIDIARGNYEGANSDTEGEVSSFQALATALSGTIGLGNIAGVAIAIQTGGPGAVFWMSAISILGMSVKFVECTLGMKYRNINPDGTVAGGPMYYLSDGLSKIGLARLGKYLAICFAIFGIGASFGGGNMFQANQSFAAISALLPSLKEFDWLFGASVAILVGLVILGGINRIGIVTSKLVPIMVIIYLLGCSWIVLAKITELPAAASTILTEAFSPHAVEGGLAGTIVQGIRRSAFSNGAGFGTSAIAHAAAKTEQPVREGIVATLEPFIDTVIVCNLTALVIVMTGMYGEQFDNITGSELAAGAFARVLSWFPPVLALVIFLFGLSTMITWSYYGQQCWTYLFGEQTAIVYKSIFLACIFIGSVVNLGAVLDFSDMMLLAMSIPNLIGCILLSGIVAADLKTYWSEFNR